jgi:CRISPR-associated protein Cas2
MKYLVAYDVCDDKRRRKIAKFLYQFSKSYQKSALEIEANKTRLKNIYDYINSVLEEEDKFHIFQIMDGIYLGNTKEVEFII